jgi:hypothetical protein|tara:strand:- start:2969 stop:3328 length:360 start_codon:yes stop_codon:yes gene_type:complete
MEGFGPPFYKGFKMTFQTDANVTQIATGATAANATADGQNTQLTRKRAVGVVLMAGSDAASVYLHNDNAAFGAGTRIVSLKAAAETSTSFTFPDNGVLCDINLSANVTGTGSIVYLYWN